MKYLYFSILFILLAPVTIQAQCTTGCTYTVTSANSTANFTLNSGQKLCINSSVTYTGTITVNGPNASICNIGTVSSSVNINFNGGNTILIDNYALWNKSINLPDNGVFNNYFYFGNYLTLGLGKNAVFNNYGQSDIQNLNMDKTSIINNYGEMDMRAGFSIDGTINLKGGSKLLQLSTGDININANGKLTIDGGATFTTPGKVNNNGNLTIGGTVNISGDLTNNGSGSITLNNTIVNVGGNFTNNGTVTATGTCARTNVSGNSTNNGGGIYTGVGGAQIDMCDGSGTVANKGFDTNNGTVSNNVSTKCSCSPPASTLPVAFNYFNAVDKKDYILVQWQTVSEKNNKLFTVERSKNGKDFETIQEIDGSGNTNILQSYFIKDNDPFSGINYYRLKQTDLDGKENYYSKIVSVFFQKLLEVNLSPNPVTTGSVKLSFSTSLSDIQVNVYDIYGRTLLATIYKNAGDEIEMNINTLSKGTYFIKINQLKEDSQFLSKTYRLIIL